MSKVGSAEASSLSQKLQNGIQAPEYAELADSDKKLIDAIAEDAFAITGQTVSATSADAHHGQDLFTKDWRAGEKTKASKRLINEILRGDIKNTNEVKEFLAKEEITKAVDVGKLEELINGLKDAVASDSKASKNLNKFAIPTGDIKSHAAASPQRSADDTQKSEPSTAKSTVPLSEFTRDFRQRGEDCYILSFINCLDNTAKGREILQKSIKDNGDGSYTVALQGDPSRPVTITADDLKNKDLPAGNKMAGVIELACKKYSDLYQSKYLNGKELITGAEGFTSGDKPDRAKAEELLKKASSNPNGMHVIFGCDVNMKTGNAIADNPADNDGGHMFTLTGIDWEKGEITYENPWNTSVKRHMSLEDFYALLAKGGGFNGIKL